MEKLKISVMLDCLRLDFSDGLKKVREMGAEGIQFYFTSPKPFNKADVAGIRAQIEDAGLKVAALCGDIGPFTDREANIGKLENMKNIVAFASAIGTPVITGHIGVIPEDKSDPAWLALHDMMNSVGALTSASGITFAIETGPENTHVLREFIDSLNGGVGVNYDPANLVMGGFSVNGADSVAEVGKYIVHTHAKDGYRDSNGNGHETPFGKGRVDFAAWTDALVNAGYEGFLTIERETGNDPVGDTFAAVEYLKTIKNVR